MLTAYNLTPISEDKMKDEKKTEQKKFTLKDLKNIHARAISECIDLPDGKERRQLERLAAAASTLKRIRKS